VFPAHSLRLSSALLAAGRPHVVLPLAAAGHGGGDGMATALLSAQRQFLDKSLA
jgi:dipeptidyl-peptidase-4